MYLVLSNIKTNKKLIISGRYKEYILLEIYNSWFDNTNYLNHHLYQITSFIRSLKNDFSNMIMLKNIDENYIFDTNVFFSLDIDKKDIKLIKKLSKIKNIKLILAVGEHPLYQIKNFESYLKYFDHIFSTYKVNSKYHKTINSFIFKEIPSFEVSYSDIHSQDATIICSNLHSFVKSNYPFRKHLINVLSSIDQINFQWYGKGWNIFSDKYNLRTKIRYFKSFLLSFPKLNNNALNKYKGEIKDKTILNNYKFNLSIENYSWPKGWFTEKFYEPLIYGCLPIYIGPQIPSEYKINNKSYNDLIINKNDSHKILNLILKYKDYDIKETRNLAAKIRKEFNLTIKNSNFNTNLYRSLKKILESY